jgi:hypothetical protein
VRRGAGAGSRLGHEHQHRRYHQQVGEGAAGEIEGPALPVDITGRAGYSVGYRRKTEKQRRRERDSAEQKGADIAQAIEA